MIYSTELRLLTASILGVCLLAAHPGLSLADDPPGQPAQPAQPASPEPQNGNPGGDAPHAAASDPALADQVHELQRQVDELNRRLAAATAAPAAPKTATDQSPSPNRSVNAKEAEASPKLAGPPPITWFGVTVYGTVDVGLAHLTHGAPLSSTYGPSLPFVLANYSNHPITSLGDNGLSQSKLGLSGVEPLNLLDLKAVFKVETGFQPTSGRLSDGPRSLVDDNGLATAKKLTAGDSGRAGQPFNGPVYAGIGSDKFGTLTFGRHNTLMADALLKYDPQLQSIAFSPIGFSGTSGGFGDTESKTLDDTIKYNFAYAPIRIGALLQFGTAGYTPAGGYSGDIGIDLGPLSVDAVAGLVRGAIAAASLSAAQAMTAPTGSLAGTISDNTGFAVMASYTVSPVKLYAGYEVMRFANPKDPLPAGTVTIGGYLLSVVSNTTYNLHKVLQYTWGGVRYSVTPRLDLTGAYYFFHQNSFNANGCTNNSAGSCSGTFHDASLVADYRFTRRFDAYLGFNYTQGANGLASGFLNTDDLVSMIGVRFNF